MLPLVPWLLHELAAILDRGSRSIPFDLSSKKGHLLTLSNLLGKDLWTKLKLAFSSL